MSPLIKATFETLYMVGVSASLAAVFGTGLGFILYGTQQERLFNSPTLYRILSMLINIVRSIPFIIFMIALIPFTRWVMGTAIGTHAALVPLSLAAIPFYARMSELAFLEVSPGLLEAGQAMGGKRWQILFSMILPEAFPALLRAMTVTVISLIGYSAMAGVVGGGGLGALAYHYGYQRFDSTVMFATTLVLIILVQCLQWIGDKYAQYFAHHKK